MTKISLLFGRKGGKPMKIIDENATVANNQGRPAKYDWEKWLLPNKKVRLYEGEDFSIHPASLRPQVHVRAKKMGGRAGTSLGREDGKNYIDITFQPGLSEAELDDALTFEKPA